LELNAKINQLQEKVQDSQPQTDEINVKNEFDEEK